VLAGVEQIARPWIMHILGTEHGPELRSPHETTTFAAINDSLMFRCRLRAANPARDDTNPCATSNEDDGSITRVRRLQRRIARPSSPVVGVKVVHHREAFFESFAVIGVSIISPDGLP